MSIEPGWYWYGVGKGWIVVEVVNTLHNDQIIIRPSGIQKLTKEHVARLGLKLIPPDGTD